MARPQRGRRSIEPRRRRAQLGLPLRPPRRERLLLVALLVVGIILVGGEQPLARLLLPLAAKDSVEGLAVHLVQVLPNLDELILCWGSRPTGCGRRATPQSKQAARRVLPQRSQVRAAVLRDSATHGQQRPTLRW
jgi:hypothetical protein